MNRFLEEEIVPGEENPFLEEETRFWREKPF
jgi:hypothetical protein